MLLLAALALAVTPPAADARRDRTVTGDVIKAARLLTTSRLDEAKTLLDLAQQRQDQCRKGDRFLFSTLSKSGRIG